MTTVEVLPAEKFLRRRHVPYEIAPHREAYTSAAEAYALGIPPSDVLKVVVLRSAVDYMIAVIPASARLDLHRMQSLTDDKHLRLATEAEIRRRFPLFELGAVPPMPSLLGLPAYVDPSVLEHESVAFADGKQTESMIANPRELLWGEPVFVADICERAHPTEGWRFEADPVRVPEGAR